MVDEFSPVGRCFLLGSLFTCGGGFLDRSSPGGSLILRSLVMTLVLFPMDCLLAHAEGISVLKPSFTHVTFGAMHGSQVDLYVFHLQATLHADMFQIPRLSSFVFRNDTGFGSLLVHFHPYILQHSADLFFRYSSVFILIFSFLFGLFSLLDLSSRVFPFCMNCLIKSAGRTNSFLLLILFAGSSLRM